jgi:triacylglycerol lipase
MSGTDFMDWKGRMVDRTGRSCFFVVVACLGHMGQAATIEVVRDIVYSEAAGERLAADVYLPPGDQACPAVLVVHGGAWTIGNKGHLGFAARQFAEEGFCAVSINYRLAPKHKFPAQLEDCLAAVAWMRANAEHYRIDPARIAGFGYSAGGHLVTLVGTGAKPTDQKSDAARDCRLQAIVAGGAPCDFREIPAEERLLEYWLGGPRKDKPELYQLASPAQFVSMKCPPMFFFHGEKDALVPLVTVKLMSGQLVRAGVASELFVVPEKGHVLTMFDSAALRRGIEFLKQHLDIPKEK